MLISAVVVIPVKMSLDFPEDIPLTKEDIKAVFKEQAEEYLYSCEKPDALILECSRKDLEETVPRL